MSPDPVRPPGPVGYGGAIDKVAEKDYIDLLDILAEFSEEEDNQLFQWVRPLHLDDENGNPDPRIAAHV